jgi:hypothetical protein
MSEFLISEVEMNCAVGVSVTSAAIWWVCSACFTSLSVLKTLGGDVGWIWLLMKARLVVPTWSPYT